MTARQRTLTKASEAWEASRHRSLGSLVSYTKLISRLWITNIMWKEFWFQKSLFLSWPQALVWDWYTSQRYADSWLTILHSKAPWVILRSIHVKGEITFLNSDQKPVEMILLIEGRWTLQSEQHAQCCREHGAF